MFRLLGVGVGAVQPVGWHPIVPVSANAVLVVMIEAPSAVAVPPASNLSASRRSRINVYLLVFSPTLPSVVALGFLSGGGFTAQERQDGGSGAGTIAHGVHLRALG